MNARLRLAYAGMHPDRRLDLLERLGSPEAILEAIERGRIRVPDHARSAVRVPAEDRLRELAQMGVRVRSRQDLPEFLATLPDAPDILFVRGTLPEHRGVAVVGSRRATAYGLRLARRYGSALAEAGWPVVSGLARGVDGAAHHGVLDVNGIGVAVLGSGPDVWYPAEHRRLGEEILAAGGAVVTEYPPGTPPTGWRFPPRNRIISGLSGVVVVVEAAVTGGALITARRALSQGRDVFAVPGDIDRSSSQGCNRLIRDGALPVFEEEDLVEAVSLVLGPLPTTPERGGRDDTGEDLLSLLAAQGRTVDFLAEQLGVPVGAVLGRVGVLETRGLVRREGGLILRER